MALHDDLLALARSLVPHYLGLDDSPVPEASLRRGVSTAYYALFHLLVGEAARRIVADSALRSRVARSFGHDPMKRVCQEYSEASAKGGTLSTKSGMAIPMQLQKVGTTFVSLQSARHEADYDVGTTLAHIEAHKQVSTAEEAFSHWAAIRDDPAAAVFLTEMFLRSLTKR